MKTYNIVAEAGWAQERVGKIGGSGVFNLLTEPIKKKDILAGNLSETAKNYLNEKIAEIITGTIRTVNTPATEWGDTYEPEAVERLKELYPNIIHFGNTNRRFFQLTNISGASPDCIEENEKLVFEIKCPENPKVHVDFMQMDIPQDLLATDKEYYYQVQMNMLCFSFNYRIPFNEVRGIFVSYCPLALKKHLRLFMLDIMPDIEFADKLYRQLAKAEDYVTANLKKFGII